MQGLYGVAPNRTGGALRSEVSHEDGRLLATAIGTYRVFPKRADWLPRHALDHGGAAGAAPRELGFARPSIRRGARGHALP